MKKSCVSVLLAMSMAAALLSGCAKSAAAENVDYNSKGWDAIVADAKKEGNPISNPDHTSKFGPQSDSNYILHY